jgi:hypothetical protein
MSVKEEPVLTVQAHVFQIDPITKQSWKPVSERCVPLRFDRVSSSLKANCICLLFVNPSAHFDEQLGAEQLLSRRP